MNKYKGMWMGNWYASVPNGEWADWPLEQIYYDWINYVNWGKLGHSMMPINNLPRSSF